MKATSLFFLICNAFSMIGWAQGPDDTTLLAQTHYYVYGPTYKIPSDSILYTYDENNYKSSEYFWTYQPGDNTYYISRRYVYTNDTSGNRLTFTYQNWNGTSFTDYYRVSYTYNTNHQILTELMQMVNGGVYENKSKIIYQYNSKFQLTSKEEMDWQGGFFTQKLDEYTYDDNGNMLTELKYVFNGNNLEKNELNIYSYDSYQRLISDTLMFWDEVNLEFIDAYVSNYDYNADGTKKYVARKRFDRQMSEYVNEFEWNWSYNEDGLPSELVSKTWNVNTKKFDENLRYLYDYNSYKKMVRKRVQSWNTFTLAYGDSEIYYYYYKGGTWSNIPPMRVAEIKLYPVPVSNLLNVDLTQLQSRMDIQTSYIEVINAMGVSVLKIPLAEIQGSINIGALASGTYMLMAHGNQGVQLGKFVKY